MVAILVDKGIKSSIYRDSLWAPGRYQAVYTIHDQHFHDGTGLVAVDETLVSDGLDSFAYGCNSVRHRVRLGSTGSRRWYPRRNVLGEYVEFGRPEYWTGTRWSNLNLGTPVTAVNALIWDRTNFTFRVTNTWRRLKLDVILKSSAAAARIRWPVSLVGLTWSNWSLISQSDGSIAGYVERPTAVDSNGISLGLNPSYNNGYVEINGAGAEWAAAVYPVYVDPTFTDGFGGDVQTYIDTWIISTSADGNFGANNELRHSSSDQFASLLKFDLSTLGGVTINSADLYYYTTSAPGVGGATAQAYRILVANSAWTEAGATWNYALASSTRWAGDAAANGGADAGCSVSGTDWSSTLMGSAVLANGEAVGTEHILSLGLTEFAVMIAANHGIYSRGSGNAFRIGSSDHATTGYRPKLVVDYTAPSATLFAVLSTATALSLASALSGGAVFNCSGTLGLITASALSPVGAMSGGASISGELVTATALVPSADFSADGNMTAELATSTALAPNGTLSGGGTIAAIVTSATALSSVASMSGEAVLSAALSTATALVNVASFTAGAIMSAAAALATALAKAVTYIAIHTIRPPLYAVVTSSGLSTATVASGGMCLATATSTGISGATVASGGSVIASLTSDGISTAEVYNG